MSAIKSLTFAQRVQARVRELGLANNALPAEGTLAKIQQDVRDEMLDEVHAMLRNTEAAAAPLNHPRLKRT